MCFNIQWCFWTNLVSLQRTRSTSRTTRFQCIKHLGFEATFLKEIGSFQSGLWDLDAARFSNPAKNIRRFSWEMPRNSPLCGKHIHRAPRCDVDNSCRTLQGPTPGTWHAHFTPCWMEIYTDWPFWDVEKLGARKALSTTFLVNSPF